MTKQEREAIVRFADQTVTILDAMAQQIPNPGIDPLLDAWRELVKTLDPEEHTERTNTIFVNVGPVSVPFKTGSSTLGALGGDSPENAP